jgi:hypothetical protein
MVAIDATILDTRCTLGAHAGQGGALSPDARTLCRGRVWIAAGGMYLDSSTCRT